MLEERRTKRSDNIHEALRHQLSACAARANLTSLILAEDQGIQVAATGELEEAEEIAALAPRLAPSNRCWHGSVQTDKGIKRATICPVQTPDGRLFLCAVGSIGAAVDNELLRSGQGVRRILH